MFLEPTVFITGAGASWHYGFPTGLGLIEKTYQLAKKVQTFCAESASTNPHLPNYLNPSGYYSTPTLFNEQWKKLESDCDQFIKKIDESDPLVIDYFLGLNPSLENIGKFLISGVLAQCEINFNKSHYNPNRLGTIDDSKPKKEDNWIKFINAKLLSGLKKQADLIENKVDFISFNYDLSLEQKIFKALQSTEGIDNITLNEFFDDRFFHVYGKVNWSFKENIEINYLRSSSDRQQHFLKKKAEFEFYHDHAKDLKIIAPLQKRETCEMTQKSIDRIRNAENVYILGYGFDDINNEKLQLNTLLKSSKKRVFFTNFDDTNIVNKRAGDLLRSDIVSFMPYERPIYGDFKNLPYHEKSTRSAYGALEKDFPL